MKYEYAGGCKQNTEAEKRKYRLTEIC